MYDFEASLRAELTVGESAEPDLKKIKPLWRIWRQRIVKSNSLQSSFSLLAGQNSESDYFSTYSMPNKKANIFTGRDSCSISSAHSFYKKLDSAHTLICLFEIDEDDEAAHTVSAFLWGTVTMYLDLIKNKSINVLPHLLGHLNQIWAKKEFTAQYGRVFLGIHDSKENKIAFTSAGWRNPFIFNKGTKKLKELPTGESLPLGTNVLKSQRKIFQYTLKSDDVLILHNLNEAVFASLYNNDQNCKSFDELFLDAISESDSYLHLKLWDNNYRIAFHPDAQTIEYDWEKLFMHIWSTHFLLRLKSHKKSDGNWVVIPTALKEYWDTYCDLPIKENIAQFDSYNILDGVEIANTQSTFLLVIE